jgi:hypothetical protein
MLIALSYNETKMKAGSAKTSPSASRERSGVPKSKPARASTRKGPPVLTEDEADILYGEKHKDEKGSPWDQVKAKLDAMDR